MKTCTVALSLAWLTFTASSMAANPANSQVIGRTLYHADNSRTESVRDPNTRELKEESYNPQGVLTMRKVFLLNEKGEPMQGNVYDGRGNLVARARSFYDEIGRRKEDHLINLGGEVFQRVIHEYDKNGKALTPKVINLNVKSPSIKPAAADYTGQTAPAGINGMDSSRFAPAIMPEGDGALPPIYAPGSEPTPPKDEKPKGNFFKRLFKKEK